MYPGKILQKFHTIKSCSSTCTQVIIIVTHLSHLSCLYEGATYWPNSPQRSEKVSTSERSFSVHVGVEKAYDQLSIFQDEGHPFGASNAAKSTATVSPQCRISLTRRRRSDPQERLAEASGWSKGDDAGRHVVSVTEYITRLICSGIGCNAAGRRSWADMAAMATVVIAAHER